MTPQTRPRAGHTPHDHAAALALVLRNEFGVGFALFDPAGSAALQLEGHPPGQVVEFMSPETVRQQGEEGRAVVRVLAPGRYVLQLTFHQAGRPAVVGAALFDGLARTAADAEREAGWLRAWAQSCSDRLRLSDQVASERAAVDDQAAQAKTAWEGLFALDQVMRRMRVHKDTTRNQQRVLETVFSLVSAQTLICVPPDQQSPVLIQGDPFLAPLDCTQLAALLAKGHGNQGGPVFCNAAETQAWALSFPSIATLMAFPISEGDSPGWVIAVNKCEKGERPSATSPGRALPFRRSDAALLTPFVALLRMHYTAATRYQDLKELMVGLARSLTAAIDAKDHYTFGHSERVARIGVEIGRTMGIDGDALSDIYLAGLLHDVGKIGVPDALLRKQTDLTPDEYEHVKKHVHIGYTILSDLRPIRHLLPGVLHHHERVDGGGYPEGLAGDNIPLLARVLAVADAYDAMSTNRPYRTAMTFSEVEAQIQQGAGTQWDAKVVEAFVRCRHKIHAIRQRGVGESLKQALDGALRSRDSSMSRA